MNVMGGASFAFSDIAGIPFHQLVGYGGALMYSTFMIPQLYKTWKTKSTNDISVYTLWLQIFALICNFYYGYNIGSAQISTSSRICLTQTIILLYMVHKYSRRKHLYATHL